MIDQMTSPTLFTGTGFILEQKRLGVNDTMTIKDINGNPVAYVKMIIKGLLNRGPSGYWFEFEGTDGAHLGEVHLKQLAGRPTYDVYDSKGAALSRRKRRLFKLIGSEWWIEDPSGQEIARANGNLEDDFTICTPSKEPVAAIRKNWTFRDFHSRNPKPIH